MEKSVLRNWEESGLLEGLNDTLKKVVANKLEEAAQFLLNTGDEKYHRVDTVTFPAVVRVLRTEVVDDFKIKEFISELAFDYNRAAVEFNENSKNDMEASFLAKWCKDFVKRNQNPKKVKLNEEKQRWKILAGIKS